MRGSFTNSPIKLYCLKKNGINQIIDLRKGNKISRNIEKFLCKILGLKYINCPFSFRDGSTYTKDFFCNINKLIEENVGTTYIHCKKGKHRTGLCVAAYEKEILKKTNPEIIFNLYNNSFDELLKGKRESLTKALATFAKLFDLR